MGWKAFNLFASARADGYFGSYPSPDATKARAIVSRLGRPHTFQRDATLESGLYPSGDELYVGAFADGLVLGNVDLIEQAFQGKTPELVHLAHEMYPDSTALVVGLHSVTNLFGYTIFREGRLVRGRAGNADDGVFLDVGEPMPFERPLLADSVVRDGRRVFPRQIGGTLHEFDEAAFGETFVMEACRAHLGCRLDEYDVWDLRMQVFTPSSKSWAWSRRHEDR